MDGYGVNSYATLQSATGPCIGLVEDCRTASTASALKFGVVRTVSDAGASDR